MCTQCIQFRDAWNAHRTSANELKNVHTYGIAHLIISWNHSTNNFIAYAISIKLNSLYDEFNFIILFFVKSIELYLCEFE